MKLCPDCRSELADDANFCNVCGCNVNKMAGVIEARKEPILKEAAEEKAEPDCNAKSCEQCGAVIMPHMTFCMKCGAKTETGIAAETDSVNKAEAAAKAVEQFEEPEVKEAEDVTLPHFVLDSKPKQCKVCGAYLKEDMKFCMKCGARMEGDFEEAKPVLTQDAPMEKMYSPPLSIQPDSLQKGGVSKGKIFGLFFVFLAVFSLGCGAGYFVGPMLFGSREASSGKIEAEATLTPTTAATDKPEPTVVKEDPDITITPSVDDKTEPDDSFYVGNYSFRMAGEVLSLASYKGVEVTYYKLDITDADVQARMENTLNQEAEYKEVIDRADVRYGDFININYTGTIDGKEFAGGSDDSFGGTDLVIGENFFFPQGFDAQLIGARVGEEIQVLITFPEGYYDAEIAGKEAIYKVIVNTIEERFIPELTDEYVAGHHGYATVEQWKEALRIQMNEENDIEALKMAREEAIQSVVDSSEISDISQEYIDIRVNEILEFYKSYAAYFTMELPEFIKMYFGMEYEQFLEERELEAREEIKRKLVLFAVADTEGIQMSEIKYRDRLSVYAEENFYMVEELEQEYSDEQLREMMFLELAGDFITENMVRKTSW